MQMGGKQYLIDKLATRGGSGECFRLFLCRYRRERSYKKDP